MKTERTGTFDLYKGRKLIATVTLTRGQFTGVKRIFDRSLLPPYLWGDEKEHTATAQLRQFFYFRFLSPKNLYYNLGKEMDYEGYCSLFDDYHLAVVSMPYDNLNYDLKDDVFAKTVLNLEDKSVFKENSTLSPNLSLFYPHLTMFSMDENKKRYILMEYSKDLADMHKTGEIPYSIEIIGDIPFVKVALPDGDIYPLPAIVSPTIDDMDKLSERLKAYDPSFDLTNKDPDYCAIVKDKDSTKVIMY